MERALSPSERAIWLMDRATALNGILMMHVRGPLDAALLAAAQARLCARHPLLRARVAEGRRLIVEPGQGAPIPVRVAGAAEGGWQAVAEAELNTTFDGDAPPLARLTLIPGPGPGEEESVVVFALHHLISDAMTAIYWGRELLQEMGAALSGTPGEVVRSLALRPAMRDLVPEKARGLRRLRHMNSYLFREGFNRLVRRPRKLALDRIAPPSERRTRFLHHVLSREATDALIARCRREETTMQGLLLAALLLAAAEDMALAGPAWVGCFSAINLRDQLVPGVGEEGGLYVSQAITLHRMSRERALFELARETRGALTRVLDAGEAWVTFPLLGLFIPWGKDPGPRLVRRIDNKASAATGITNVGRMPVPGSFGPLTLSRLHFAIGAALIAPVVLAVGTFEGALAWNLLYVEPLVRRERAEAMARRIASLLGEAA